MATVITARLSLAVRLLDTTTGSEISETDVTFFFDGMKTVPMKKGSGTYVFVNMGREDFLMRIKVRGFDEYVTNVKYESLDPKLPILDAFLMPSENNQVGGYVLKIDGTLSGLKYLEAINLDHPSCAFQSVTVKKNVARMSVLPIAPGGGVALDTMAYILISKDLERYETFAVEKQEKPTSILLKAPLKIEHELNDRIFRIIYGKVSPEGNFLLKARDDSNKLNYLLHFAVGEVEYIRRIDFHEENGNVDLLEGATQLKSLDKEEEAKNE